YHEWLALMAAQSVGALEPDHLQLVDVLGRDVRQRAVAGQGKIAARRRPLIRIGHSLKLLLVGASHRRAGHTHHQRDERAGCGTKLEVPHVLLLSLASSLSWFSSRHQRETEALASC